MLTKDRIEQMAEMVAGGRVYWTIEECRALIAAARVELRLREKIDEYHRLQESCVSPPDRDWLNNRIDLLTRILDG